MVKVALKPRPTIYYESLYMLIMKSLDFFNLLTKKICIIKLSIPLWHLFKRGNHNVSPLAIFIILSILTFEEKSTTFL